MMMMMMMMMMMTLQATKLAVGAAVAAVAVECAPTMMETPMAASIEKKEPTGAK